MIKDVTTGFVVKDRRYHFKIYPTCFVGKKTNSIRRSLVCLFTRHLLNLGSEATDWLVSNTKVKNREEAVELGDYLRRKRLFGHVVETNKRFLDGYYFYRFTDKPKVVIIGEHQFLSALSLFPSHAHTTGPSEIQIEQVVPVCT